MFARLYYIEFCITKLLLTKLWCSIPKSPASHDARLALEPAIGPAGDSVKKMAMFASGVTVLLKISGLLRANGARGDNDGEKGIWLPNLSGARGFSFLWYATVKDAMGAGLCNSGGLQIKRYDHVYVVMAFVTIVHKHK
ncbi:hypothetical protein CHS0354_005228 [Potamilus streckersoni]|uniref:Uncharacterized protein n=1 Tax=Potamilus streckersoni TaxID=2493646 RepID=A0AAE0VPU6_9BIVA|nr:hypothetical protein CHS0354_005228 [Potamilus streckersoni]